MEATGISATTYLSIFGIVVLLICLALTFTGRATPLRAPQKIKGFGVELEISVLTLLVLVGFCLSISSIYIHLSGYQKELSASKEQLSSLKNEIDSARKQLEAARKFDMTVFVKLDGVNGRKDMPKLEHLRSFYTVRGQDEPIIATVSRGVDSTSVRIGIKNLTPETLIERLDVVDADDTPRTWIMTQFYPLNPTYQLNREEQTEQ
jgi:hypothetical protein